MKDHKYNWQQEGHGQSSCAPSILPRSNPMMRYYRSGGVDPAGSSNPGFGCEIRQAWQRNHEFRRCSLGLHPPELLGLSVHCMYGCSPTLATQAAPER